MSRDIIVGGDNTPLTAFQQSYHWRNKNCKTWAHQWIKTSLPGLSVEEGGKKVELGEVSSVSGDCDLGQRKGKLLTIYDFEVEVKWVGTDAEGEEVKGELKIPEMSHEAIDGLSDYQFNFSSSSSSASSDALVSLARKSFPPILVEKLNSFRADLLAAHTQPSSEVVTPSASGSTTPAPYAPAPPASKAAAEEKEEKAEEPKKNKVGSTAVVEVTAQLHASAEDLWGLLTDESRIPMWSRSAAKMELKPGGSYELFGGNVRGKVEKVDKPKQVVMSWQPRRTEWPSEHYATLTLAFDQGSDSTTLTFKLDGVPTGQESDIEKAIDQFYIRGLKQMGLGTIL